MPPSSPLMPSRRPVTPTQAAEGTGLTVTPPIPSPRASTSRSFQNFPLEVKTKVHEHLLRRPAAADPKSHLFTFRGYEDGHPRVYPPYVDLKNLSQVSHSERMDTEPAKRLAKCRVDLAGVHTLAEFERVWHVIDKLEGPFLGEGLVAAAQSISQMTLFNRDTLTAMEMVRERMKGVAGEARVAGALLIVNWRMGGNEGAAVRKELLQSLSDGNKKAVALALLVKAQYDFCRLEKKDFSEFRTKWACNPLSAPLQKALAAALPALEEAQAEVEFNALLAHAKLNEEKSKIFFNDKSEVLSDDKSEVLSELAYVLFKERPNQALENRAIYSEFNADFRTNKFKELRLRVKGKRGECQVLQFLAMGLRKCLPEPEQKEQFNALKAQAKGRPGAFKVGVELANQLECFPEEERADEWDALFEQTKGELDKEALRVNLANAIFALPPAARWEKFQKIFQDKPVSSAVLAVLARLISFFPAEFLKLFRELRSEASGLPHELDVYLHLATQLGSIPETQRPEVWDRSLELARAQLDDKGMRQILAEAIDLLPAEVRGSKFQALLSDQPVAPVLVTLSKRLSSAPEQLAELFPGVRGAAQGQDGAGEVLTSLAEHLIDWLDADPSTPPDGVKRLRENGELDKLLQGGEVESLVKQSLDASTWGYGSNRFQNHHALVRALTKCLVRGYQSGLGEARRPPVEDASDSHMSFDEWRARMPPEAANPAGEERVPHQCAALYMESFKMECSYKLQNLVARAIGRLADENRWIVLNELRERMEDVPNFDVGQAMGGLASQICEYTGARGRFLWRDMAHLRANMRNEVTFDG